MVNVEDAPAVRPPRLRRVVGEVGAVRELVRNPLRRSAMRRLPRGDGSIVLVFPGLATNDPVMAPLRRFLKRLGYDSRGWGIGPNLGRFEEDLDKLLERVDRLIADGAAPISLVGWSLGGVLAREVARDRPKAIRRVIMFGAPLAGPRGSTVRFLYNKQRTEAIEALIVERMQTPLRVPITSIYSRADGIVNWRTTVDAASEATESIEVRSNHLGMGFDPDVWTIIAERLAE